VNRAKVRTEGAEGYQPTAPSVRIARLRG